jgi:hypothetical protein
MAKKPGNWIQGAIKHKGALTKKAEKAGGLTKGGSIKSKFLSKAAHSKDPTTRSQANLAKTLSKMSGKGKK